MFIKLNPAPRNLAYSLGLAVLVWLGVQGAILIPWQPAGPGSSLVPKPALDLVRLPLAFERNDGQIDESVAYLARGLGGTLLFRTNEVVLSVPTVSAARRAPLADGPEPAAAEYRTLQLQFLGANPEARLVGAERQSGTVNYLIGNDPAHWQRDIPTFASIHYEQVYPGIDLRYEGLSGQLKGTYVVAPGADPARIRWQYTGAEAVQIHRPTGELRLTLAAAQPVLLVEQAPVAWQVVGGQRTPVAVRYVAGADGSLGFALGAYDPRLALAIDPTLTYASYLGGNSADYAYDIAVDAAGNFYVTGATGSTNFPLVNPIQAAPSPFGDLFVSKFNANGTTLAYSTYLGGNDSDVGFGIAVDDKGNAYVTGESWSSNFPTVNPLQVNNPGIQQDVIVLKLNPAGNSLVYSTYLGGFNSQTGWDLALDAAGNVYVTGHTLSPNFPVVNAVQPQIKGIRDAFVTKINAAGSALMYSTFLGSSGDLDYGFSIAVDSAGHAYVTGQTTETDFPTVNALQPNNGGFGDAFVSQLSASGTALVYSTYLGGAVNEVGRGIAVNAAGNAYLTGWTESLNFPTTGNAFQPVKSGFADVFVTKVNAAGSALVYSTFLGGSLDDGNYDSNIAVDSAGHAYVAGNTHSTNFPVVNAIQPSFGGDDSDAFVTRFSVDGATLVYSTFVGGSAPGAGLGDYAYGLALGGGGNTYVTGYTFAPDFPLAATPFQAQNAGNYDAFVVVINEGGNPPPTPTTTSGGRQTPVPTATPTPGGPTPTATPAGRQTPIPTSTATQGGPTPTPTRPR